MSETKPKHRISIISAFLLILNIIVVVLLLISYSASYINPVTSSFLAIAGLMYPIILAINLAFVLFWLFSKKRFSILSLIVILAGWNHLGRLVQFNSEKDIPAGSQAIKVLSYNIQNFIKKNVTNTKYISNFDNQLKITNFIKKQDADIVCLQEVLYDREGYKQFASNLSNDINCKNYYLQNYFQQSDEEILDAIAIFTKYPIINDGSIVYEKKTIGIFTDILIQSDTIRIYNLHLASIRFKKEDYEFMSDITNKQEQEEFKESSIKVISKIRAAFVKRGNQVSVLKTHIRQSPFPLIICGDFNDTPSSYVYRNISKNLNDAFVISGKGFANTFAGGSIPSIRIDYILYDNSFHSMGFKRHKINLSDHFPISSILVKD
ncbi:MAG: endonuclease/exonuclease/phosphatase family protein [Bacteroidales bacterium]|nr:endonuclease/exonuclease/phosphatase family protein [Bacteroidales bacterium]